MGGYLHWHEDPLSPLEPGSCVILADRKDCRFCGRSHGPHPLKILILPGRWCGLKRKSRLTPATGIPVRLRSDVG